jgi:hypothetical protein
MIVAVIAGGFYIMTKPSLVQSKPNTQAIALQPSPPSTGINPSNNETEEKTTKAIEEQAAPVQHQVAKKNKSEKPDQSIKAPGQHPAPVSATPKGMTESKNQTGLETENQQGNDPVTMKGVAPEPKIDKVASAKKKKLGDVIKGIFKKPNTNTAKADIPPVLEEPRPATNRQSTRREEGAPSITKKESSPSIPEETNTASIASQLELSSNAPDNWMMGVSGLKVTLKNRSSVTIQTALVYVLYFDDNNQLLDKKTITFNTVTPKSKMVVAAPDHKYADHVEFKLGTITIKEDRVASN